MDETDLRILREMSRDKVVFWGNLDPRLSARAMADRLGVPESTVRARLRAWEQGGFMSGIEVLPNPALFDATFAGGSLRVEDVAQKARVLDDLALVDGMVVAQDHVGAWVAIAIMDDGAASLDRRRRLLSRLPGVAEVTPCEPFRVPPATAKMTPLAWRILRALRADPRAPLAVIAERVGISVRTLARHYDALVSGGAVWSVPLLDFTRYDGAVAARFILNVAAPEQKDDVAKRIRAQFANLIELERSYEILPDFKEGCLLDMLLHLPSAGAVEEVELQLRAMPGVATVEHLFPRANRMYRDWFDERIAARVLG